MKTCNRCEKPTDTFPLTKKGKPSTMCTYCYLDTQKRNAEMAERNKKAREQAAPGTRICTRCRLPKPVAEFQRNRLKRAPLIQREISSRCKECREYEAKYAKDLREKWTAEEKASFDRGKRDFARDCRTKMIEAYGRKCQCCGETEPKFLAVDHVNNDGYLHRKQIGYDPTAMYRWAKKHSFPNTLQLLCHNCNVAKAYYGECPHKASATPYLVERPA